jgi:hypothetical protein
MIGFALLVVGLAVLGLLIWRMADQRAENAVWDRLAATRATQPETFDLAMLAELPEPAQRFFRFAIRPGTPLRTVAAIDMEGDFSLGTKERPNYMPMRASQILAAPHGFVWKVSAGSGPMKLSGSDVADDGRSWSRFWLSGVVPVARAGASADHIRSSFGRYVAEAVFWTPAAVLPNENVSWTQLDENAARVSMRYLGLEQAVDVSVGEDGRPLQIVFQRWSNANREAVHRLQPFGGYLSQFNEFDGFCLPTRVEAGNHFASSDYFAFYRVNVTRVRFP